jgi:protein TonB
MKEEQFLEYVSSYRDLRPKGGKRFLFWASLALHAFALIAFVVVPLTQVDRDLPQFESMATFLVRPPQAPPPPPPPPPPAPVRRGGSQRQSAPRLLEASFIAPVEVPNSIPAEDFGGFDFGVPGGVEGGLAGGIVGGLADAPPASPSAEPVRLDSGRDEARPIARVEPVYPDLAAQARVQGIVILEVLVDVQGLPESVNVLRSVPLLEAAAVEAVRQWRWNPYKLMERAVPFWVTVTVNFRLT